MDTKLITPYQSLDAQKFSVLACQPKKDFFSYIQTNHNNIYYFSKKSFLCSFFHCMNTHFLKVIFAIVLFIWRWYFCCQDWTLKNSRVNILVQKCSAFFNRAYLSFQLSSFVCLHIYTCNIIKLLKVSIIQTN